MIAHQNPEQHNPDGSRYCDAVREKFRTVFERECTLPNECLMKRYAVTSTGDLIMILR